MPLDRTWYNTLVDDDGSGLTGTVWDKADVDALMDAVDAEIARIDGAAGVIAPPYQIPSLLTFALSTGTYHDFAPPGAASNVVWLLQGSLAVDLTGIVAEPHGTMHLLVNGAGFAITLKHSNAGSSIANRFVAPGLVDYVIPAWYHGVWVMYFAPLANWIVVGRT